MSFLVDPDAVIDVAFDWSKWLSTGESISNHLITPTAGITVDRSTEVNGVITVWLSHGVVDTEVVLNCHVSTDAGRQDDRSMHVTIKER